MVRLFQIVVCAIVLVQGAAHANTPGVKARIIPLTAGPDLALALKINAAVDRVSNAVSACVASGQAHAICLCRSRADVDALHTVTAAVLAERPAWNTDDAVLYWESSGISHNLAVAGVVKSLKGSLVACSTR